MDKDEVTKSFYQFFRTKVYFESIDEEWLKHELLRLFRDILTSLDDDEKFELLFALCHTYFDEIFDEVHRVHHIKDKWGKNVSHRIDWKQYENDENEDISEIDD
jgi:hypothetical protein